jgi:hypothetical protein
MDMQQQLPDSSRMWIRRQLLAQARMPSMRQRALNPRAPAPAEKPLRPAAPVRAEVVVKAQPQPPELPKGAAEKAATAGGFHESSYELQQGLLVSESEWPDDVTVPGALGDK